MILKHNIKHSFYYKFVFVVFFLLNMNNEVTLSAQPIPRDTLKAILNHLEPMSYYDRYIHEFELETLYIKNQ